MTNELPGKSERRPSYHQRRVQHNCGCIEFAFVEARLRPASGEKTKPFGGFSVILVGDPAQLPPVGNTPQYILKCKKRTSSLLDAQYMLDVFWNRTPTRRSCG